MRLSDALSADQQPSGFLSQVANTQVPFLAGAKVSEVPGIVGAYLNARAGFLPGMAANFLAPKAQAAGQFATEHAPEFEQVGGMLGKMAVPVLQAQGNLAGGIRQFFSPQPQTVAGKIGTGVATATAIGQQLAPLGRQAGEFLGGTRTLFSKSRQIALAQKSRTALGEVIRGAGPAMEQELSNLSGTVDLSHVISPLREAIANPETGAVLQTKVFQGIQTAGKIGDTTLRDMLNNPELAQAVTPLQAQQVMNTLRQAGSTANVIERGRAGAYFGKGGKFLQQVSGEDLQLLQHANEVKQTLISAYPDTFGRIGEKFGQTVSAGRFLTPKFKEGNLVGNILSGFKDPEIAAKVRETLPSNIVQELFAPSHAAHAGKVVGQIAMGGGAIEVLRRLFNR